MLLGRDLAACRSASRAPIERATEKIKRILASKEMNAINAAPCNCNHIVVCSRDKEKA
jgi:hypothetical protein